MVVPIPGGGDARGPGRGLCARPEGLAVVVSHLWDSGVNVGRRGCPAMALSAKYGVGLCKTFPTLRLRIRNAAADGTSLWSMADV